MRLTPGLRHCAAVVLGAVATLSWLDAPAVSAPASPDGRIPLAVLGNSTLELPAWPAAVAGPCPSGKVAFAKGAHGNMQLQGAPVYTDIDHDGAPETVVRVDCQPAAVYTQVIVFDRDSAGAVVTLGRLIRTDGQEGVDVVKVWDIAADVDGQVRIDVGDYLTCCGAIPADLSQHQWRRYGMRHNTFVQTGGPTRFGPNPHVTDLVVAADATAARQLPDGTWTGSLTVRVRNAGRFTVGTTSLGLTGVSRLRPTKGWDACPFPPTGGDDDLEVRCGYAPVEPGEERTFTFRFASRHRPTGAITVRASSATHDGHRYYRDANVDDNAVTVAVPGPGEDRRSRR